MMTKVQVSIWKAERWLPIGAWRVFALLTRDNDPDKLPIDGRYLEWMLVQWVDSEIFWEA